jgi:hypothetical protein
MARAGSDTDARRTCAYPPLWRWVAEVLGQVLACLAHRHTRPAGHGADIGDRRERAYCQKSSFCHQATSSSRSGSVPPWRVAAASTANWSFFFAGRGTPLGQEPLAQSRQGQRVGPAGPAPVQRVRGDAEEHLAGKGIVPRVQRRKLRLVRKFCLLLNGSWCTCSEREQCRVARRTRTDTHRSAHDRDRGDEGGIVGGVGPCPNDTAATRIPHPGTAACGRAGVQETELTCRDTC